MNEVSFGCENKVAKASKGVKCGGHVGFGGSVGGFVVISIDTSDFFGIGGAYLILYLSLMVDGIFVNLIKILWFE